MTEGDDGDNSGSVHFVVEPEEEQCNVEEDKNDVVVDDRTTQEEATSSDDKSLDADTDTASSKNSVVFQRNEEVDKEEEEAAKEKKSEDEDNTRDGSASVDATNTFNARQETVEDTVETSKVAEVSGKEKEVSCRPTAEEPEAKKANAHSNANDDDLTQPGAFAVSAFESQTVMEEHPKIGEEKRQEGETEHDVVVPTGSTPERTSGTKTHDSDETSREQNHAVDDQTPTVPVDHAQQEPPATIQDENDGTVPMLVAQLVTMPVQALEVVFDEDPEEQSGNSNDHARESHLASSSNNTALKKFRSKSFQRKLGWGLLLCVIVLCIAIPLSIKFTSQNNDDGDEDSSLSAAPSSAPAPGLSYECFSSTSDVIVAQYVNPTQRLFIMCPQTTTQVGYLANPAVGDLRIVGGDIPLMITRDNIEVRCGIDGRVKDNCVLKGGFLQVLLQKHLPNSQNGGMIQVFKSGRTDNVTIRGLTFTGQIQVDYSVGGASVVVSNPGENVSLIDCRWENLTAPSGVVYVGINPFQASSVGNASDDLGLQEAELRIIDSTFRNVTYGGGPLLQAWDQILVVERCQFSDIWLSPFVSPCSDAQMPNAFDIWCQNLIHCSGRARCLVQDICVENFEYAGMASIMKASYTAEVTLGGSNYIDQIKPHLPAIANGVDVCPSGFAWISDDVNASSCMDDDVLQGTWMTTSTCSIRNAMSNDTEGAMTMPTNAPTFSYDCFTSTFDLIEAQYDFPEKSLFVMCPNTRIQIGMIANPFRNDTRIINGDVPLMVVRSNVEVRCGLDGDVRNDCILDGGQIQVFFQSNLPTRDRFRWYESDRTDNVTIVGMTFTGQLAVDPLIGASSVVVSNPGNVVLMNCMWTDMVVGYGGFIFVGTNPFQILNEMDAVEIQAASLTIVNSTVQNIEYSSALMEASEQSLTLQGCKFQDIRLSAFTSHCDSLGTLWCQGFLYCTKRGKCRLEDLCIDNVEFGGGALFGFTNDTQTIFSGTNFINEITQYPASAAEVDACPSGVAEIDIYGRPLSCLEIEEVEKNWTATASCTLG